MRLADGRVVGEAKCKSAKGWGWGVRFATLGEFFSFFSFSDWGCVRRYNLQTEDGAHLWVQTSGPRVPAGELHLRVEIETGDKRYYWLNNIVGELLWMTVDVLHGSVHPC